MEKKLEKDQQNSLCFLFGGPLFRLKATYFLIYSVWFSTSAYMALLPTKIVSYSHIALLYALVPVVSVLGPVIIGLIADKFGNYKNLLLLSVFTAGLSPFGVLWLYKDHESRQSASFISNDTDNCVQQESVPFTTEQSYTFPLLMTFRLVGFISTDAMSTLIDVCGLTTSQNHGGDFARQKLWGPGSMIVIPFICGIMVDLVSQHLGYPDDSIAFIIGGLITLAAIPLILKLDVVTVKNTNSLKTTAKKVVGMIDLDIFILVQIIVGMCYGFHADFLPVFIHNDLIGSKTMIGIVLSINGIGTMVILSLGKIVIQKLGEAHTVIVGLLLYCVRFLFFYFIENPWILLATEFFEGFSGYISFVAGSYYCVSVSPPGMLASLNGIVYAAVFGLGRGLGTSIGSSLMSNYSIRTTYLCFSSMAAGTAVLYFIFYHLFLKEIRMARLRRTNTDTSEVFGIENPAFAVKDEVIESKVRSNSVIKAGNGAI